MRRRQWHRAFPLVVASSIAFAALTACSGGEQNRTEPQAEAAPEEAAAAVQPSPPKPPAEPTYEAPPGTALLPGGKAIARTCSEGDPCPDLLQPAGAELCAGLEFAELTDWRLPTKSEVEGFAKADGLGTLDGYHWTATPDDVNPKMFWIVDPNGTQPTTIPADRKPFRIRCVHDVPTE